jgi:hypothetical protein
MQIIIPEFKFVVAKIKVLFYYIVANLNYASIIK